MPPADLNARLSSLFYPLDCRLDGFSRQMRLHASMSRTFLVILPHFPLNGKAEFFLIFSPFFPALMQQKDGFLY
jgi:hypothetical protein